MKSIKNYIKDYIKANLNESRLNNDDVIIRKYINDNYAITGNLTISKDLVVDCDGGVYVKNKSIASLTDGLFRWGKVRAHFDCNYCENLKNLEGAPKEVGWDFNCDYCEKLISLKGAPEKINGDFYCSNCKNLRSLEGAPEKIKGFFYCANCKNLKITDSDNKKYRLRN